jgi:hypothetical protein
MLRPFTIARYGMYCAMLVAIGSVFLGYQNGASLDYVVLRGVVVFVIFATLAIAAEGILMWAPGVEEPTIEDLVSEILDE